MNLTFPTSSAVLRLFLWSLVNVTNLLIVEDNFPAVPSDITVGATDAKTTGLFPFSSESQITTQDRADVFSVIYSLIVMDWQLTFLSPPVD